MGKMSEEKNISSEEGLSWIHMLVFSVIFIAVLLIWFFSPWLLNNIFNIPLVEGETNLSNRALFGDSFGAVNTLFSGLAFLGVIYAIFLQQKELELTRKELKGAREAQEDIQKTQEIQRFENTFFNLLKVYTDMIPLVSASYGGKVNLNATDVYAPGDVFGYDAIEKIYKNLKKNLISELDVKDLSDKKKVGYSYCDFFRDEGQSLLPVLGSIQNIICFIEHSNLSQEDKKSYYDIFKRSLSKSMQVIIFYNEIRTRAEDKKNGIDIFNSLVRHDFFSRIAQEDYIDKTHQSWGKQ